MPVLSVVMPVHNALPHLETAIESILDQTFADFEFVILDDASTDGSGDRIRYWKARDPRIRLLRADVNLGPVGSSNMVARAAHTPFVARMDADDVSYPTRLADQLELLREAPDVGVAASLCDMIDASGRKIRGPEAWRLSRRSVFVPFAHGAMMYRRDVFDEVGGYREECEYWEDQDLVVRMAEISRVLVIPRPLYQVRAWSTSTRFSSLSERSEEAIDRMYLSTDRLSESRNYDDLLEERRGGRRPVDPRVFIALGGVRLWAGDKPRLLGRLLKRGRLAINSQTVTALIWTMWASVSPSSLRGFLMLLFRMRNRFVSPALLETRAVPWEPGGPTSTTKEIGAVS